MKKLLIILMIVLFAVPVNAERFFSTHSTWYEPVPTNPTLESNSVDYVTALVNLGNFRTAQNQDWGMPIFQASGSESIVEVYITTSNTTIKDYITANEWNKVPIPSGAVPAGNALSCALTTSTDGHMTVISSDGNTAWDFYAARNCEVGSAYHISTGLSGWVTYTIRKWDLTGKGINNPYDGYGKQRVASTPLLHGVVTYDEVAAGTINHAISFISKAYLAGNTTPNVPRYPTEGIGGLGYYAQGAYTVQPGMRAYLDPDFDCTTLNDNFKEIFCIALQDYGMIFVDSGGDNATSIILETGPSWENVGAGSGSVTSLSGIPLNQFRFIEPLEPPFDSIEPKNPTSLTVE